MFPFQNESYEKFDFTETADVQNMKIEFYSENDECDFSNVWFELGMEIAK